MRDLTPKTTKPVVLGKAIVNNGKSVQVPTGELRMVGLREDGKPITAPVQRSYLPGDEVELDVSEIERLRGLGFLLKDGETFFKREVVAGAYGEGTGHPEAPTARTETR
jgi:hypothetical protein